MTDTKDSSMKGGARPTDAPGQKRPHATLDLKAVEVKEAAEAKAARDAAAATAPGTARDAAASATSASASAASPAAVKPAESAAAKPVETKMDPKAESQPAADKKPAVTASPSRPSGAANPSGAARPARSPGLGSVFASLAAGLAGGLIVLFGGDKLASVLGLPAPGAEQSQRAGVIEKRLALVEQQAKSGDDRSALEMKLAAAEARLARIEEQAASIGALQERQTKLAADAKALAGKVGEGAPATERVAKLEERLATLAAAAETDPDKGRIQGLAALTGKLADLETNVSNQIAALRKLVPQEVEGRLAPVAESSEAAKTGTQRLDRDLAAVRTETARVSQRVDTMKAESDRALATLRALQEQSANLQVALTELRGGIEAQLRSIVRPADVASALGPVANKVSELEQNLAGVVKAEEDRKANAERIVMSLELANLKRALEGGQAYGAELEEVRKISGGRLDLAALDRFKDTGVPALTDLENDFRPVAHAILDADAEPESGSVMDRLLAGAKSVVRVRKVNHADGDKSTEAVVGRIEAALRGGDLAAVLTETAALPEKARGPAADWLAKVEARNAIDRAIAAVESQLKASLAGNAAPAPTALPGAPKTAPVPADAGKL